MITLPERLKLKSEVYRKLLDQFEFDMRVASPGIIQSFNATSQTVTVKVALREKINLNGNLTWEEIPVLVDVPVFMPRAGNYVLTMPVTAGDECLVIFGDACMDAWWQSGGIQNQIDRRRHDLSDGFALLGVWSQPKKISGYSTSTTQLRNLSGDTYAEIDGTTVNVIAASEVNVSAPTVNVDGSGEVNVTSPSVNIGNSAVVIGSNTTIDSRIFLQHEHNGVEPGNGTTAGVV